MSTSVIVPFRGGCPQREAVWQWARAKYVGIQPELGVVEASPPDGPWCKAAALRPAIEASSAKVVVLADADCWTDGLPRAVAAVQGGEAWAVPHTLVYRLTRAGTDEVLAGGDPASQRPLERPYRGIKGGGIVVVRRELLLEVPFDDRFEGWGKEDRAWRDAMQTLVGQPWRGDAPLFHLWHPPQPRRGRIVASPASEALYRRYRAAKGRPKEMRRLVCESL